MRPAAKSPAARSAGKSRRRVGRAAAPKPYHHGDLRRVLIDAALQLVGEGGPMRSVSARPPAAPGSRRGRRSGIFRAATP